VVSTLSSSVPLSSVPSVVSTATMLSTSIMTMSTVSQPAPVAEAQSGTLMNSPKSMLCTSTPTSSFYHVRVSTVSPLPVISIDDKRRKRKSRTTQAADLTSTPYKKQLESTPANQKRSAARRLSIPTSSALDANTAKTKKQVRGRP